MTADVDQTVQTRTGTVQFPCFDGLRALAAMSVLVFHAAFFYSARVPLLVSRYLGHLDAGVVVFFLISGFLLYRPYVESTFRLRPARPFNSYILRRFLRIVPAYWLALTILTLLGETRVVHGMGIPIHYGLLQIYFPDHVLKGLGVAWSLCTEISFYITLPAYAWWLTRGARARGPRAQLRRELAGIAVLYCSAVVFGSWASIHEPHMIFWLPANTDLFGLGMLLAVLSAWQSTHGSPPAFVEHRAFPAVAWGLAALVFTARVNLEHPPISTVLHSTWRIYFVGHALYGLVAFLLLLPAVFGPSGRGIVRRALQQRAVVFVGLVSYGVYLWHGAVITKLYAWTGAKRARSGSVHWSNVTPPALIVVAVIALLTVGIAAISYYGWERPFLRLKDRGRRLSRVGSAWPPRGAS